MRIALFILGTVAVIYLMVKGFKQVLEESREQRTLDHNDPQPPQQLNQQRSQHPADTESDTHARPAARDPHNTSNPQPGPRDHKDS